jgi:hypothetical protein
MSSEIFSNISPLYLATGLFTAVWGFTALRLFTAVWGMKALPFRRVALRTPLLAVVLSICLSGACWGQSAKLSPELRGANVPADLDVIIQYNQTPSESSWWLPTGAWSKGSSDTLRVMCIMFLPAH